MSTFQLISSLPKSGFGDLVFADLKQRLEEDLGTASSPKDLEHLIHSLSALMKEEAYTEQERYEFKKIRQRAYDKRRNPKSLRDRLRCFRNVEE
ncbi:MAG: hypothetical protein HYW48_01800 [Deltaproteobacteria bacterium]|nr:hypothetical protein [Deltaproteobacteria bacterium]